LGYPSKFQRVSHLGFVTAVTSLNGSQPNFARRLTISRAGTLYIHFWGFLLHNGILPGAKFTLCPSLALSYISSVTARHSSSGRQPNFAALSRGRHLYSAGWPSRWALAHILVMAALHSRCGHYILSCGFFLSICLPNYLPTYLSIFFSSPNLSGCRMDVYHTSTHDVVLVRI